ncbi:hypothetical protein BUALT_Bualt16G0055100 [Buddleja alternifolia]|uniref:Uncharacterized protein n=1 Tax=Buddleja alternifolia TaxID=168488 RepID=A0AAV6W718_9LAMI|nr:hypothetical protein BUALT_Bualt16G0055100 [Buddleja alternifolia]
MGSVLNRRRSSGLIDLSDWLDRNRNETVSNRVEWPEKMLYCDNLACRGVKVQWSHGDINGLIMVMAVNRRRDAAKPVWWRSVIVSVSNCTNA